uniref:G protein gamma domain-containing protein n=1 Tax=Oncorhynchus kisutch TaxID=8019 RepID=A0A8C7JY54_ONCKI
MLGQVVKQKSHLGFNLATLSTLVKWIEGCVCDDPFLNPELMRANPWVEKGKCVIL